MTFFFFVVGLEARREFDLGELRDRTRITLPVLAGLGGLAVPVLIFVALNAGDGSARHAWAIAMSTDTAFALGVLALVGPKLSNRLRAFMVTVLVVDDLVSLAVITTVYSETIKVVPLMIAVAVFALTLVLRATVNPRARFYFVIGVVIWVALHQSGVDPLIIGLAMGLLTWARPVGRPELEQATELFRLFREQPTPELARTASASLTRTVSPNERLQLLYHPWSSYVIVPLFALANAGIPVTSTLLSHAFSSSLTLGIVIGYVVGKPLGLLGASWLATRRRLALPVGWGALGGGAAAAGIGFTVSLLIADRALSGQALDEAKLGVICSAVLGTLGSAAVFRALRLLPEPLQLRAFVGPAEAVVDLSVPVDPGRDHLRGPVDAPVTLVEYGDFECPYCGQAEPIVRELLATFGDDLRYVWRHLPLTDVHTHAQLAAEGAEAAASQDAFWEMYDVLLHNQEALRFRDLVRYADQLGLDVDRFIDDMNTHVGRDHIAEDVESADLSGVSGTPTFFVNGRRHYGAYDVDTLSRAVHAARNRAVARPAAA
jgi:Na+/H+ antiporter NhaA/protein-disulfide isomerase